MNTLLRWPRPRRFIRHTSDRDAGAVCRQHMHTHTHTHRRSTPNTHSYSPWPQQLGSAPPAIPSSAAPPPPPPAPRPPLRSPGWWPAPQQTEGGRHPPRTQHSLMRAHQGTEHNLCVRHCSAIATEYSTSATLNFSQVCAPSPIAWTQASLPPKSSQPHWTTHLMPCHTVTHTTTHYPPHTHHIPR